MWWSVLWLVRAVCPGRRMYGAAGARGRVSNLCMVSGHVQDEIWGSRDGCVQAGDAWVRVIHAIVMTSLCDDRASLSHTRYSSRCQEAWPGSGLMCDRVRLRLSSKRERLKREDTSPTPVSGRQVGVAIPGRPWWLRKMMRVGMSASCCCPGECCHRGPPCAVVMCCSHGHRGRSGCCVLVSQGHPWNCCRCTGLAMSCDGGG